jgi:radical SAM superfamily enzyme YgiQ (UPF0313 family)
MTMLPERSFRSASEEQVRFPPLGATINALLVWPKIPSSYWSFEGMLSVIPESTVMPPLGLLTLAALVPKTWNLRLIDCAFQEVTDTDLRWANLVLVSAMQVQRVDAHAILRRARSLGVRTIVGGPYASSQPEILLPLADHVVVGEPDEVFEQIAHELETGAARRLYQIIEKPDVRRTPPARFDLLELNRYASMAMQFSRGCPFQCEFCDIITIYGRRPRTKTPAQVLADLDQLYRLGWRKQVFLVDDNFIGNHKLALELAREIAEWQRIHNYPFVLYTEASLDLAQYPDLIEVMVRANFLYVFIGIESPSVESLKETRKFQNLRCNSLDAVRFIQRRGLWVTGGFIVGFDSDTPDIFERQIRFIESAAIPWAMTGVLQAPPTTPLFERLRQQGRLLEESTASTNFHPPNFRTTMPLEELLKGLKQMLERLYEPNRFYRRALTSLEHWKVRAVQHPAPVSFSYRLGVVCRSLWHQGVLARYRVAYWKFLAALLSRYSRCPQKLWWGFILLISGHHFITYSSDVCAELENEIVGAAAAADALAPVIDGCLDEQLPATSRLLTKHLL